MRDKIVDILREVPIAGKTYEEYIVALADHLIENTEIITKENKNDVT